MFDKGVFADQTIAATARYAISEVNIDWILLTGF
jgi:hypothetical protein